MITKDIKLRIARPTDNLTSLTRMYIEGLGFTLLGEFRDQHGFSGSILGSVDHLFHLEFTSCRESGAGRAPSEDNLLVFYIEDTLQWKETLSHMIEAGFKEVLSYNPYWDQCGRTLEDIDGYRVVLANRGWE